MYSLQGNLLVASPHLHESPFSRTVVLLLYHHEDGAFGIVLNRPIDQTVKSLWEHLSDQPCQSTQRLSMGGPVSGPIMALHKEKSLAEMDVQVPGGVYVAATKEHLEQLVLTEEQPFRLFIGHAGWTSGQLEQELRTGVWMIAPATAGHVFGDDENLWKNLVFQIGQSVLKSALGLKHFPDDVSSN